MILIQSMLVLAGRITLDLLIPRRGGQMHAKIVAKEQWLRLLRRPMHGEMHMMGTLVVRPLTEEPALKDVVDWEFQIPTWPNAGT
jgi:hypothetical protein